ncbi:MAG: hypothetical protein SFU83_14965 [Meiothermus sp.]|nr:hypothetical protein [Meiothermus sp.]
MAQVIYNRYKARQSQVFWAGASAPSGFTALLLEATVSGAWDPDLNTVADLLAVSGVTEMSGGSYARQSLASLTATEDDTNDRVNIDAANLTFGAVSGKSALALVIFENGASDAARNLVGYYDTGFGTLQTPMAGGLTVNITDFLRNA